MGFVFSPATPGSSGATSPALSRPAPVALGQGHDPSPNVTPSPRGGSEGVGGAVQRQAGSSRDWGGRALVTERWNGLPACRPLILAPCCRDHVLPTRRPDSCSPHFDNDEKQTPSPGAHLPLPALPPAPSLGCTSRPAPPQQGGIDGAQPHTGPHRPPAPLRCRAGGTDEPPGPCVGWAAPGEMLLNFLPFDASCPLRLPAAWGPDTGSPQLLDSSSPATRCPQVLNVSARSPHDKCRYQPQSRSSLPAPGLASSPHLPPCPPATPDSWGTAAKHPETPIEHQTAATSPLSWRAMAWLACPTSARAIPSAGQGWR